MLGQSPSGASRSSQYRSSPLGCTVGLGLWPGRTGRPETQESGRSGPSRGFWASHFSLQALVPVSAHSCWSLWRERQVVGVVGLGEAQAQGFQAASGQVSTARRALPGRAGSLYGAAISHAVSDLCVICVITCNVYYFV